MPWRRRVSQSRWMSFLPSPLAAPWSRCNRSGLSARAGHAAHSGPTGVSPPPVGFGALGILTRLTSLRPGKPLLGQLIQGLIALDQKLRQAIGTEAVH